MSDYTPQVGDEVRRTFSLSDGVRVIYEGTIDTVGAQGTTARSAGGRTLWDKEASEQTTLLGRPPAIITEPGTLYGDPTNTSFRAVRIESPDDHPNTATWMLFFPNDEHEHLIWGYDEDVRELVLHQGWVRMNFHGEVIKDA